jgi:hypothetical protein
MDLPAQEAALVVEGMDVAMLDMEEGMLDMEEEILDTEEEMLDMEEEMLDTEEETMVTAEEILVMAEEILVMSVVATAVIHLTDPTLDVRMGLLHFDHTTTALARLIHARNASTQHRSIWLAWRRLSLVANWHLVV